MIIAHCIKSDNLVEKGKNYAVEKVVVGKYHSIVYLKDFKESFNSILFTYTENGKPCSIIRKEFFDPYL